jgi:hypothetical protein
MAHMLTLVTLDLVYVKLLSLVSLFLVLLAVGGECHASIFSFFALLCGGECNPPIVVGSVESHEVVWILLPIDHEVVCACEVILVVGSPLDEIVFKVLDEFAGPIREGKRMLGSYLEPQPLLSPSQRLLLWQLLCRG